MSSRRPEVAGFVLAGGASRRMGSDKALLPIGDGVLLQQVAAAVRAAVGNVTVVAPMGRYEATGLPLLVDRWPGEGPLGGILTALDATSAEWNLVVAVDMPQLDSTMLSRLVAAAAQCSSLALVPTYPDGASEPLCALYRRQSSAAMRLFFDDGGRRSKDALALLPAAPWPITARMCNVNTPEQWEAAIR